MNNMLENSAFNAYKLNNMNSGFIILHSENIKAKIHEKTWVSDNKECYGEGDLCCGVEQCFCMVI